MLFFLVYILGRCLFSNWVLFWGESCFVFVSFLMVGGGYFSRGRFSFCVRVLGGVRLFNTFYIGH